MIESFSQKVMRIVREIPKGSVLTYKEVAEKAGSPRAYRAVGAVMKRNFNSQIPCHRVIRSDGEVGKYNRGGSKRKKELLREEGFLK